MWFVGVGVAIVDMLLALVPLKWMSNLSKKAWSRKIRTTQIKHLCRCKVVCSSPFVKI